MLDTMRAVFEEIAKSDKGVVVGVDVATLLRRLLLFETVIIRSVRLREVPFLIRAFGKEGFAHLFNSGILKISAEVTVLITDAATNGVRQLPLSEFSFGIASIQSPYREKYLREELRSLQGIPGLKNIEREQLQETLIAGLTRPPDSFGSDMQEQFENDLRANTPALREAIALQVKKNLGEAIPEFEVHVEEPRHKVFRVMTNLSKAFGDSEERVHHEVLAPAISAVGNLNTRLMNMVGYSAMSGFAQDEAPLLFGKLAGLMAPNNPKPLEDQFARVIRIANLPDIRPNGRIDVTKLLKARDSAECVAFRAWLERLDARSDSEVEEMIGGMRSQVGTLIRTEPGKAARLAVTTALGLIPAIGPFAGVAAGAVDSFLLERVFNTTEVFAFLTKTYPSLFKSS